jgi:hypothetical protein
VDQIDFSRQPEFLDTELEKLMADNEGSNRRADKLIKCWLKNGLELWFLNYVEAQGYDDHSFDVRMFEGTYRVRDKYKRPVTGLAIYTNSNRKFHFVKYEEEFFGSKSPTGSMPIFCWTIHEKNWQRTQTLLRQ